MSYEQYGQYQGAPGQEPPPGQVSSPQDGAMTGMSTDQAQQPQYQQQPDGGENGNGQGGEGKTTLW